MYEGFWADMILNNLTVPAIIIVLGIGLKILQHYADKFVEIFTTRQKTESMEKIASVREKLVMELDKNTEAAVASNMDMVDKMKAAGHKLTEEQIQQVNDSAKLIIHKSLPTDIGGMTAADILGGEDVLNSMINSLMEKYVLEYKIKRGAQKSEEIVITPVYDTPVYVPEESVELEPTMEPIQTELPTEDYYVPAADDLPQEEYFDSGIDPDEMSLAEVTSPEQPLQETTPTIPTIQVQRLVYGNETFNIGGLG